MYDITVIQELAPIAERLAKSSLIPSHFKKPEDALYALALGQELGLSPMYSLNNIVVIGGKPSLSADGKLAICKSHPSFGGIEIKDEKDSCTVTIKRNYSNGTLETRTVKFTMDDAKKAGLLRSGSNWEKYPARMLKARALGYACSDVFNDILAGISTPEELQEIAMPVPQSYEIVDASPFIVDQMSLAQAYRNTLDALDQVALPSRTRDEYIERAKSALAERSLEQLGTIANELIAERETQEAKAIAQREAPPAIVETLAVAESIPNEQPPAPVESPEQKGKEIVLAMLRKLIQKGWNEVHIKNSVKKHLSIDIAEDEDWEAMLWKAEFKREVWLKAYNHWKAESAKVEPAKESKALTECRKALVDLFAELPEDKHAEWKEQLASSQTDEQYLDLAGLAKTALETIKQPKQEELF